MSAAHPISPSSSPRLPSPPPIAEDQTGPQSPSGSEFSLRSEGSSNVDDGASRRIRPGTKAADMNDGPPLLELSEVDSPFQLTEHLKALHFSYTHPKDSSNIVAITRATAAQLATAPASIDRAIWLYELCRFLVQKVNIIIVALFSDAPACSAQTCPEMRASEWQYLCAVHDPPKSCCAIDYCCHTLDWAANTLTSSKYFPSRINLGEGADVGAGSANNQLKNMTNVMRRVYRIFAHAWFQHRDVFWRVEGSTGLFVFFKTVCDVYNLIPDDNYTIPPEAEGIEGQPPTAHDSRADSDYAPVRNTPSLILRRDAEGALDTGSMSTHLESPVTPDANLSIPAAAATARRHRQSPSKGSNVATVVEENEDEDQTSSGATALASGAPQRRSLDGLSRSNTSLHVGSNAIRTQLSDDHGVRSLAEGRSIPVDLSNIGLIPSPKALERPSMIPRLSSPGLGSSPSGGKQGGSKLDSPTQSASSDRDDEASGTSTGAVPDPSTGPVDNAEPGT